MPERVFISYSHQDAQYKDKVLQQLRVLETQGLLRTWSDDRIRAGSTWYAELTAELNAASIVVLLITANFLTSDFILNEEVPRAFENRRHAGLRIFPVLCRPCAWETVGWLSQLQMWPATAQPLWRRDNDDAEQLLSDLAREIARIAGKPIKQVATREIVNGAVTSDRLMAIEAEHGQGLIGVAEMVRQTIAAGAPLYNNGDREACATIYANAIKFILSRLPPSLDQKSRKMALFPASKSIADRGMGPPGESQRRSMPGASALRRGPNSSTIHSVESSPEILSAIANELTAARDYADRKTSSFDDIAWRIRYAFDRLLILAESLQRLSKLGFEESTEPLETMALSLRNAVMRFLHDMDEMTDRAGIDSDDDYEMAASTSATLGIVVSRGVAEILELTMPSSVLRDRQGLQRKYERLTRIDPATSQVYRTIHHSRHFLRAVLRHKDS